MERVRKRLQGVRDRSLWLRLLWYEWLRRRGERDIRKYSDLEAINRLYRTTASRLPDLERPILFSEKHQWLKLNYRNPLMERCTDKLEVRGYVEERGYATVLNEVIGVYRSAAEIDLDRLPDQFVVKATHGSGWNLVCRDKRRLDWRPWKLILESWLRQNFFCDSREWVYRNATPRLLCETYLEDGSGGLRDYKIYCFDGEPRFAMASSGRGGPDHAQNFYDLEWSLLPFGKALAPRPDISIPKPLSLDRMIEIAGDLATPFSFVRADFYEVDGRPIFGELTFSPGSGRPDFLPPEYDEIIGAMWRLPEKNI